MAELPGRSIWGLRLIIIVISLSCILCADNDNWDRQFLEMKTMMAQLDSKISAVDGKLSNLNILEYAFKMNTIDNSLKLVNSRIDQMAVQMDSIKESLRNLPSSPCSQPQQNQEKEKRSDEDPTVPAVVNERQMVQKLDDYGRKILQSQKDLQTASKEHQQALSGVLEVVKNGFAKVIAKVDSLLKIEGQMTRVISLIRQVTTSSDFIREEVSNLITDVSSVKVSVSNIADTSTSLMQVANEVKKSIIADRTQCSSDNAITTEIRNLKEFFSKQRSCGNQEPPSNVAFSQCINSIENLVGQNLPELKAKLTEMQTDITRFVEFCKDYQSTASAQGPTRLFSRPSRGGAEAAPPRNSGSSRSRPRT